MSRAGIELELNECFSLMGTVTLPAELGPEWGLPKILVSRMQGSIREEVARLPVGVDGSFEAHDLPVVEADQYIARLEGGKLVPSEQEFESPREGDQIHLQFIGEVGHSKWFQVLDSAQSSIDDASAVATWSHANGEGTIYAEGGEEGYLAVMGLPEGPFTAVISAEGMVPTRIDPILMPEPEAFVMTITMSPGYSVQGRCLRDGEPVHDFELRYWDIARPDIRNSKTVLGSADGAFIIDDLPSPRTVIVALATDFGRSEPVRIDLQQDGGSEVTLEVSSPSTLRGTLVDAVSGEGITNASVEVYTSQIYQEMDPIGPRASCDAAGGFELPRLSKGSNVVSFRAPGYSTLEQKIFLAENANMDLGTIELHPCQALTAELILPEGEDPTSWVLCAEGIGAIAPTTFGRDGRLKIEEANAGEWRFTVRDHEGVGIELIAQRHQLVAGEEWHLVFDIAGGRSLLIEAIAPDKSIPMPSLGAFIQYQGIAGGTKSKLFLFDEEGRYRIPGGVGEGSVVLRCMEQSEARTLSAASIFTIGIDDPQEVVIELPLQTAQMNLRVTDDQGVPMSGVAVVIRSSQHGGMEVRHGFTDARGGLRLGQLPEGADFIDLTSPLGGVNHGIPFDPMAGDEVIELVFDRSSSISLRLADAGAPQSALTCRLWSPDGSIALTSGRSPDEDGGLHIKDLGRGRYQLRVEGVGYWPVRQLVEATETGTPRGIEVRRLASLQLEFVGSDGVLAANQVVELECLDLGERARNWIASGQLRGFESGLKTDDSGKLNVEGIPRGEYRWACGAGSGRFELKPGERIKRRLVIP